MRNRVLARCACGVALLVPAMLAATSSAQAGNYSIRLNAGLGSIPQFRIGTAQTYALGAPAILTDPSRDELWQQWRVDSDGFAFDDILLGQLSRAHLYKLVNRWSGKCLDVQGPSEDNGTAVHQWNCYDTKSQDWAFLRREDGRTRIVSLFADKCLDVPNFRAVIGARLQIWSCSNGWNQAFSTIAY